MTTNSAARFSLPDPLPSTSPRTASVPATLAVFPFAHGPAGWHHTQMITRQHTTVTSRSVAQYSDCLTYRYSLTRTWDDAARRVLFVMLNPSTADEIQNDPTVERCEQRSRRLGYGAFRVANIFAFRATDPKDMRAARAPVGPMNDAVLREGAAWADDIIAAWGVHGAHMGRGPAAAAMLAETGAPLFHLGLSKAGHPKHPLYLPYSQLPQKWNTPD